MSLLNLFRRQNIKKNNVQQQNYYHENNAQQNVVVNPNVEIAFKEPTLRELEQQASEEAEEIAKVDASCRKSEHGLTVSQILLLDYCKKGKYPHPEGGYQRFWWFDYGVRNVGDALKNLEAEGFIRFATPKELLPTLKLDELKRILSELKLPVTGKKADLVNRISEQANDVMLSKYIHSNKYVLTELGEIEVAANSYIPYCHSHKYPEATIWDVNKNADLKHWRDYIWGRFNQCSMEYADNGQWGLYRNTRLSMAEFLYDEARYVDSFALYAEVCFYDVNGKDCYVDYDDPSDLLLEGILSRMKKTAVKSGLSEDQQKKIISEITEDMYPIKRRVPKDDLPDLIMEKMHWL
uniref:SAP domain-containing protein n=1 Tax=Eubacterium cellulosolvens TaxID=29322 RepID=UPI0004885B34|nr:SAP domain-containing protein [[Eubacterium] cellulosolvens]